jgi:type IV secretion system protein VirB8
MSSIFGLPHRNHTRVVGGIGLAVALMTADWQPAPPVAPGNLPEYYSDVVSFQSERNKRTIRNNRIAWSLVAALAVANLGQTGAIIIMQPLVRVVPYLIVDRGDGSWDAAASMSDLSPTQEKAVIEGALWKYVRSREGYNYAGAPDFYALVSAMSSPQIRATYQQWFVHSKTSPQQTIGQKGQIHITFRSLTFLRERVALVSYRREELMYGAPELDTNWSATVGFELTERLPDQTRSRLVHPGGIIVTSYQANQDTPQGAQ